MALEIFFAVLTFFLVSYLVVLGVRSLRDWEEVFIQNRTIENESRDRLLAPQVMTLGILLFCGIYFFYLSIRISTIIHSLDRGWKEGWLLSSLVVEVFFALVIVLLIVKASDVARFLGNFESTWPRTDELFRKFIVGILVIFSCCIFFNDFPVIIDEIFRDHNDFFTRITSWLFGGSGTKHIARLEFEEMRFLRSMFTTIMALVMFGYRNELSCLLAVCYGEPSGDE